MHFGAFGGLVETVLDRFGGQSRRRRRVRREAALLVREGKRRLRRGGHRIAAPVVTSVRAAITELQQAVADDDFDKLMVARDRLDKKLDEHLGFVAKSPGREYVESFGVAIFVALLLRAFVVEPFKIPSGSMIPTLQVGDHIFVNKFIYGVRLPYTNIKFAESYRRPERGEVVVFLWPVDRNTDFIKRIVAIAGDIVELRANVLYINHKPVERQRIAGDCHYSDVDHSGSVWEQRECEAYRETLDGRKYTVFQSPGTAARQEANYGPFIVPAHHVFCMGDNRDNSNDSRFWGPVDEVLIKGKAMFIWWSFGQPGEDSNPVVQKFQAIRGSRMFHTVR